MANVLAALGGAAAGIANALQQQRQYNMEQTMMRAQLAAMGATSAGAAPDPNDPNAPGNAGGGNAAAGLAAGNPAAALMTGQGTPAVSGPPTPAGGPLAGSGNTTQGGTVASLPGTGDQTQSGVGPQLGNATQSGVSSVPTNQADVINLARAAQNGLSGGSASGSNGGGVLAAMSAANAAPGISGTPTPADPIGGINSGLTGAANDYVGAMRPTGSVDLGNGMKMPTAIPPQQAEVLKALFAAKTNAAMQQQQQQFAAGQEAKGEQFASGQQSTLLGAEASRQQEQLAAQKQISNNQLALEGKRLDQQHDQMMAMLGFKTTAQTNKAQDDVLKDLQPTEQSIMSIQHAQKVLQDGTGNPADVSAGMTAAYAALGGQKNPRLTSQIISIAGGAANESIPAKIDRIATMAASGKMPPAQLTAMQGALGNALQGYQQQWQAKALSGAQAHPEAPDLADRLSFRGKLVAGLAPGGGPLVSAGKPDPLQYKAQGKTREQFMQDMAAWSAGQSK